LAEIAISTAEMVRRFDMEPRIAMLSFSSFGSRPHPLADKMRRAVEILHARQPRLIVDGEVQADAAVTAEILEEDYPFSSLKGGANVLIFPDLEAGSIAYKLLARLGGAEVIGPMLVGLSKPVYALQRGADVDEIVKMATIAAVAARDLSEELDAAAWAGARPAPAPVR
jgi:malate dehydrogenase (oxaloacetate-decarboxylating)(NADP+)